VLPFIKPIYTRLTLFIFYSTGHQAFFHPMESQFRAHRKCTHVSLSSSPTSWLTNLNISYPLSALTIILNSLGGIALLEVYAQVSFVYPKRTTTTTTRRYFLLLLLGSSIGLAILRRHLMVWKVFAPRFMLGVLELLVVDVAGWVGCWVGDGRVRRFLLLLFMYVVNYLEGGQPKKYLKLIL
jgi:phosphatidylinositol glycan class O